jgi:hypothetical protein
MNLTNYWNGKLAREMPDAGSGGEPVPAPTPDPAPGPDLSFVPADFHVDGKPDLTKFTEHYQSLVANDAKAKERAALVPEDAAYDMALPDDLKFDGLDLPEGFKVALTLDDPAFQPIAADLKAFLKETGAPKDAGKTVAALIARYEAAKFSKSFSAMKEDAKILGTPAQAQARVETVSRALQGRLPAEQAAALQSMTGNARALQALEALLSPQGLASPTPTPPAPIDPLAARYPKTATR